MGKRKTFWQEYLEWLQVASSTILAVAGVFGSLIMAIIFETFWAIPMFLAVVAAYLAFMLWKIRQWYP